ncbi:MAG: 16S rRNA (cytosine(1402)-N(4))-methyltransferase RsmH [Candidatus Aminicenantes bacterium]|nr:16S rRNA (cytosine(1402)-N(4))-methyltransferase RsmH [Candidatus Aminicenantes bacterium]
MTPTPHIPVLLQESMDFLDVSREGIYVDCTIGLGGHAYEILSRNQGAEVVGFDIDEKSLLMAKERLLPFAERVNLYHSDFRYLPDLNLDFSRIRGVLLDLGISSYQLDSPERGFSFNLDGPLDMRMDFRNKTTAEKIVSKYSEKQLEHIFREYGELRQAHRLAREIAHKRKVKPIETTRQLLDIVESVCRWRPQKGKTHPAARVFQAIRIEINQELKGLSLFLERIAGLIRQGTRIVAISFHSLEDRIIKHTFLNLSSSKEKTAYLKTLTRKPVIPTQKEIAANFRARSAKLRCAEKI